MIPALWEHRQEEHEHVMHSKIQASLGYLVRPHLKTPKQTSKRHIRQVKFEFQIINTFF
jgi:hypothetical protein